MTRIPAKDYRERAKAVLEQLLMVMKAITDSEKWSEPTEKKMESLIDEFHHILNWAVDGARQMGLPAVAYPGPLTEDEMCFVESRLLQNTIVIKNDKGPGVVIQSCE